jgi:hypothetical protein
VGRVSLLGDTRRPSGVTIRNSRFGPGGDSDGIANGSNGTRILDNEFVGIKQLDNGRAHADSIQLYGSSNALIRGNWFHGVSVGIMAADGADHEIVEDNVIEGATYAIQLGADKGSIIRHNTLPDAACDFNKRCGIISLGGKQAFKGSGTAIEDNILSEISFQGSTPADDFNLLAVVAGRGGNDLRGLPTYVGGTSPTSYAGFALADGSRGKGTASDGLDRGIRLGGRPDGTAGDRVPLAANRAPAPSIKLLSTRRTIAGTGRLGLRVDAKGRRTIALRVGVRIGSHRGARTWTLLTRRVVVRALDRAGGKTITIRLTRAQRRALGRARSASVSVRSYADPARTQQLGRVRLPIRR